MMPRHSVIAIAAVLVGLTACSGSYRNSVQGSYGSAYTRGYEALKAEDYTTAADEYAFAARSGHPKAEIAYGQLFVRGRGVEEDPARALTLFESAYGKTSSYKSKAAYELGTLLLAGGDGPSGTVPVDPERARPLLEEALAGGETRAASRLGLIYEDGLGVPADPDRAITYYNRVADDDASAALRLANLLAQTNAPQTEMSEAVVRAVDQLEVRAEEGNERSWIQLADIYSRGELVDPDPERALGYLENLSETDDPSILMRLSKLYGETGDAQNEKRTLRLAADAGNARAQSELAKLSLQPDTPDTNGAVGRYYAERAIGQGSTGAMVYLGVALLRGEVLEQDVIAGEQLLRRASEDGHVGATSALGSAILRGIIQSRQPDEGRILLETAADAGSSSAMSTLGFAYQNGRGLPKDEILGREWLRRAAEAGNQRARDFLAEERNA